jgi:sugar/nucleoside kinase (ribokinase family)
VEADRAEEIYDAMTARTEASGGSAGNTAAGIASFGGSVAFIGRVRDDALGDTYAAGLRDIGVHFDTPAATNGPPTGRSMIIVTPDAERTMNTCLGAANTLPPEVLDPAVLGDTQIVYAEGYLWDVPETKEALVQAMDQTRAAGGRASLTLSDSFCVDRFRAEFLELIPERVDVLFANEDEICSLFETDDWEEAAKQVQGMADVVAITRSEKGSVVVTADSIESYPVAPVENVVDTTGAGDLFAAGFLYGLTQNMALADCARLGGAAAGACISQIGPRPDLDLSTLI